MTGWYPDVQKALFARGWRQASYIPCFSGVSILLSCSLLFSQNPDLDSPFFDLKWMLKSKDVKHGELADHQMANHFSKASNITTKVLVTYVALKCLYMAFSLGFSRLVIFL